MNGKSLTGNTIAVRNAGYTDFTVRDSSYTDFTVGSLGYTDLTVGNSNYTNYTVGNSSYTDLAVSNSSYTDLTLRETVARTKTKRKRKLNAKGKLVFFGFGTLVTVATAAVVAAGAFSHPADRKDSNNLKKEVIIEAGSMIKIEDFFSDCPKDARFLTDVSDIDTNTPAVYKLTVFYEKTFTEDVTLKIEDHTGPEGTAVAQTVYTTWKMPEAEECVGYLYDLSGIAKVEYMDEAQRFTESGLFDVPVIVTDMYGNTTKINVPFTVIDDRMAPEIVGVHDFDIEGDVTRVNLMEGIYAIDDYDDDPVVRVNDSLVNYNRSGEYELTYSAIDKAGNISSVSAMISITIPDSENNKVSDDNVVPSVAGGSDYSDTSDSDSSSDPAYDLAENIMSSLWRSNDVETARAIFNWVHSHIYYQPVTTYMSYEDAAYRGFSRRNGDCYVYFSCAKMLLDCAGIPNLMVERYPVYTNGHYWNLVQLNGEWYHCDATVFMDHPSMYFMCTDDEIDDSHHSFNGSLYPERAGGSSDYLRSSDNEQTATPTPTVVPGPDNSDNPVLISDTEVPVMVDPIDGPVGGQVGDPVGRYEDQPSNDPFGIDDQEDNRELDVLEEPFYGANDPREIDAEEAQVYRTPYEDNTWGPVAQPGEDIGPYVEDYAIDLF